MKKILALIIAIFILNLAVLATSTNVVSSKGNATTVHASAPDAVLGLWGGKWDDTWPVFLLIQTNSEPNTYKFFYLWLEHFEDPKFSTRVVTGYPTNNYIHAKFLDFRMTATNGLLYGEFKTPRMANLVRLNPSDNPSRDNADDLLRQHGWTENAILARKAFEKITGP